MTDPRKDPVWRRWRDLDPREFAFSERWLWTRVWRGRRWDVQIARVRWVANPGRLEAEPFDPPEIQRRVHCGVGWWAHVAPPP